MYIPAGIPLGFVLDPILFNDLINNLNDELVCS